MISVLFNKEFYNIDNKSNKELAIRPIDCKFEHEGLDLGYLKGFIFDLNLIGGPNEEDFRIMKKESDDETYAFYKELGKLEEFNNMVKDNTTDILNFVDEVSNEKYISKNCFTESDYEDFLDENNLDCIFEFANNHRYVILIQESDQFIPGPEVNLITMVTSVKEALNVIFGIGDCIFINSEYKMILAC